MRDFYLLAFILALPALAVLGHDIYMAYTNTQLEVAERFYFSDLGWLWTTYSPDTYKWALENTDEVIWNAFIDPVLKESAFYVLGAPFAAFAAIMLLLKIFGVGPFEGHGLLQQGLPKKKKGNFAFGGGGGKERSKYKRK